MDFAAAFTVVIQTCYDNAATTVPVLLESLTTAGVPPSAVLVVCGKCPSDDGVPLAAPGFRLVPVTHAGPAGLICVSERPDLVTTPWLLCLQDTMAVGQEFTQRALEAHRQICDTPGTSQAPVRCVKVLDTLDTDVGLYDARWLGTLDLAGYKGGNGGGGEVFDLCPVECARYMGRSDDPDQRLVLGEFRYSEGGVARTIEHYPVLDLYHFTSLDLSYKI